MIVDSSALLAVLWGEPEAEAFLQRIDQADSLKISAVNYVEAAVVLDSRGDANARRSLDAFLQTSGMRIEGVTPAQALVARDAYRDYGKGRHPAGLNLADCFAYALAKVCDEPLLYKGNDFGLTDVRTIG